LQNISYFIVFNYVILLRAAHSISEWQADARRLPADIQKRSKEVKMTFEEIYKEFFKPIYSYILTRERNEAAAQDIAAVTWRKAFEKLNAFDESRGSIRQWLFGIARNEVNMHYRLYYEINGINAGSGGNKLRSASSLVMKRESKITQADSYNDMQDEDYTKYEENSFRSTITDPVSTFSSDVDTASYNIVRRQIMQQGIAPNPDAVRTEEFINYFDYSYPQPQGNDPVSINFEYSDSPWNKGLKLVKVGIKAKDIEKKDLPPGNLIFLIDVSGSMEAPNRLPLVKKSLKLLVDELRKEDLVSIVTYASGVSEVLSGVKGSEKEKIMQAVESLGAGGSTSGSEGLAKAYEAAKKNFIRNGNNRVILATDGDFNIGPHSNAEMENQITKARESGVFLSVLGYGMGNYKDSRVQALANKGNGNYAYINDLFEARKVLVKEFGATLFAVAKDVKIQAEFNPAAVAAYRLIGYEKRKLNTQDFNDDTKDAGEMGAGHTVTAIYDIIPAGVQSGFLPKVDGLKYTQKAGANTEEVLTLKLRYKEPSSEASKLMERVLAQSAYKPFEASSDDMRFAASVAWFAQILKDSPFKGVATVDDVIKTARRSKGRDDEGYRADFIKTAEMYKLIE
jgi:Ca-activated chloride channel family protein